MAESFFATLECELLDRQTLRTHTEAHVAVFEFIESWYDPLRRHSALDYRSPTEFERIHRELGSAPVSSSRTERTACEDGL
jgi:putative transposase